MALAIDWEGILKQLDWASVIATIGAIVIAFVARSTQKEANASLDAVKQLTIAMERAMERLDDHFKANNKHVTQLIGILGRQRERSNDSDGD